MFGDIDETSSVPKRYTSYRPHLSLCLLLGSVVLLLSIAITPGLAYHPPVPLDLIVSVLIARQACHHSRCCCFIFRFHAALPIVPRASTVGQSRRLQVSSKSIPRGERKRGGETRARRPVALGAWSRGLVSSCSPFCARILYSRFVAIYNLSYVSLTTRTRVTPKEGAAACSLPCGVGGVGRGGRMCRRWCKYVGFEASADACLTAPTNIVGLASLRCVCLYLFGVVALHMSVSSFVPTVIPCV